MANEFRLPDIGEGLVEAEIIRWHVAVGDEVTVDQVVVEVETAKSIVDIPSPFAGTVLRLGGSEGDVVEVGDVLIVVGSQGDEGSDTESTAAGQTAPPAAASSADAASSAAGTPSSPVKAMPAVRKLAADREIDLSSVVGTGPGGAIVAADLDAFAETSPSDGDEDQPVPMSRTRRAIAEHMSASWHEIPHVTTLHEAIADRLLETRARIERDIGAPVPVEALVIKAVLPVLDAFPQFASTIDGDNLILRGRRDIGVAVDTPDGLVVPVIRQADEASIETLCDIIVTAAERARVRRTTPDEMAGAVFTITNIGAVGGGYGTPIIPLGTVSILSVGRAQPKAVVRSGEVVVATMMPLSISYDHRVIDGALGQRFMSAVIANLEDPTRFVGD